MWKPKRFTSSPADHPVKRPPKRAVRHRASRPVRVVVATVLGAFVFVPVADVDAAEQSCADTRADSAPALTAAFAGGPDGMRGADYQRAVDLPDGRRLWTFQDAFVARPGRSDVLVHNVGVVQVGSCFDLIRGGSADRPAPWLAGDLTVRHERWFWPLGATVVGDTVRVFLAEFHELGDRYLAKATPVATWLATVDLDTLHPVSLEPAPDSTPALYGWSVVSDDRFTYLYAHCYRQFGYSLAGHDPCSDSVTVARTSHDLTEPLRYWNGSDWTTDSASAASIAPTTAPDGAARTVNPMQIAKVGDWWIAVTKDADWFGDRIYVDVSQRPTGPWTTARTLDSTAPDRDHNNYFASFGTVSDDEVVIGLSHNRWDGRQSAIYRPTFRRVSLVDWGELAAADVGRSW